MSQNMQIHNQHTVTRVPLIALTTPALDGGIGRNILNLADAFQGLGYRIQLLIDKPRGPYLEQLHPAVEVVPLPTSHALSGIPRLGSYLRRERPDVLLTPNVRHTGLALHARSLFRSSVRVYVNVHNTYSKTFQNLSARKRRRRLAKIKALYPRCDGIIPVSAGVAADFSALTALPAESLSTIYNPVVTRNLEKLAEEPIDHPWFRDDKRPIILAVSRLEKAKNLPLLIEAFELVRWHIPARLMLLGDGTQRSALQSRIQASPYHDDILLLGYRKNPYKYMKHASLFVLSSSWEGFGNVLVEAMATGTPVVSTDCPHGPREILDDGRYGPLVPIQDACALATAVLETLRDPLPQTALKQAVERFRDTTIAQQYLELFGLTSLPAGKARSVS